MNYQMRFSSLLRPFLPTLVILTVVIFLIPVYQSWKLFAQNDSLPQQIVPSRVIPYQGTLTNEQGQPINESLPMTFRLYNSADAVNALWTEAYTGTTAVEIQNGQFQVWLGSQNPFPSQLWENNALYLGIQIDNDAEMVPREQLGAAPFAIQSDRAFTIADRSVTSAKLALQQQIKPIDSTAPMTGSGAVSGTIGNEISATALSLTLERPSRILYTAQLIASFSSPQATQTIQVVVDGVPQLAYRSTGQEIDTVSIMRYIDLSAGNHQITLRYLSQPEGYIELTNEPSANFVGYLVIDQQSP